MLATNLFSLFQVEQCDASVSYNTQLLVAHFSPLDLKITTFLGSNFMHGSQLVKKDRLTLEINLVKPQLFNLCQVLRFRTITVKVLIISEYVICFLSKTLYVLGICESHGHSLPGLSELTSLWNMP